MAGSCTTARRPYPPQRRPDGTPTPCATCGAPTGEGKPKYCSEECRRVGRRRVRGLPEHRPLTNAQQALVEQWTPLARRVVTILRQTSEPVRQLGDDAHSAALLALCWAARGFDPRRRIKFCTYAWRSVARAVLREASMSAGVIRHPLDASHLTESSRLLAERVHVVLSLDQNRSDHSADSFEPAATPEHPDADAFEAALELMTNREREAVELTVVRGMGVRAAAAAMGTTVQRVEHLRRRALGRVRRAWGVEVGG